MEVRLRHEFGSDVNLIKTLKALIYFAPAFNASILSHEIGRALRIAESQA